LPTPIAGRILARNQPQVGHELARMAEARQIPQFGNDARGMDELMSTELES
jgi:hypothetical protein